MGQPSSPKAPVLPTAGESLESVINTLVERLPEIQELLTTDVVQNLATLTQFAPAFTTAALAQEAEFGSITRAAGAEAQRQTLAGQLFNIGSLTPGIRQAEAFAAPGTEATRGLLERQVFGDLAAGGELGAPLQRELQQQVRAGQAARGISFGAAPISEEALFLGSRSEQLKTQRQQAASNLIRLNVSTQISPFQFATGGAGQQAQLPQIPTQGTAGQLFPGLFQGEQERQMLMAQQAFNVAQLNADPGGLLGQGGGIGRGISGASAGSTFGPIGAGIGGLLGFL